jgi:hypothetical protein
MTRLLALGVLLSLPAFADNTLPAPPPAGADAWAPRCAERLKQAQDEAARGEPAFATGEITVEQKPPGVRFEAKVPDAEHARFYRGVPARFLVHVVQKRSKEPGELGGTVGSASDGQASLSSSRWTVRRLGSLEVQVASGRVVHLFGRVFKAAVDDCLK